MTMPTYKDYVDDETGQVKLREMVRHERTGPEELLVPPRVNPEVVTKFLEEEVGPDLTWEQTQRAGDIARFYRAEASVKHFAETLQKDENTQVRMLRAIECLRAMGDLGDGQQQQAAAEYFDYLLDHRLFPEVVEQMIECFFHLDRVPGKGKLETQIQKALRDASRGTDPEDPPYKVMLLQERLQGDLPVVTRARLRKQQLLGEGDDRNRATGLAKTYVGLDAPGGIDWPKWAAFEIMGEVRRSSDANAAAGLQAALDSVPDDEPRQYQEYARGRALKGILFLGGKVKQEQKQWLVTDRTRRFQLQG